MVIKQNPALGSRSERGGSVFLNDDPPFLGGLVEGECGPQRPSTSIGG